MPITKYGLRKGAYPEKYFNGHASYTDTQYTSGSPFVVLADVDTVLPNNAGVVYDTEKPVDVLNFWDGSKITGRNGDNLDVMLYFQAVPTAANQHVDVWVEIGGTVGLLYTLTWDFPRGIGINRGIIYPLPSAYTRDTWQANGGTAYVRSNAELNIYGINFNFDRSHSAK